jgi:hypothetical protein
MAAGPSFPRRPDCWRGPKPRRVFFGDGVTAREKLRQGVEAALLELGQGFIENPVNAALRRALSQRTLTGHAYFEQLVRVILAANAGSRS